MDGRMFGWLNGCMHICMYEFLDGWMDRLMAEWSDGC